ncbi:MAG: hypothetical protein AAFR81_12225 [Chloroflexota bacterium]
MRFRQIFSRIGNDFRQRRNVDAYVVSGLAIIFAVFSVLGDDLNWVQNLQMPIILSALGVLVYHITTPEQEFADLDTILNDRSNIEPFAERIKGRRQVWMYAASAVNVLNDYNMDQLRKEVLSKKDGQFHLIVQNPQNVAAVDILVKQLNDSLDYQVNYVPDSIAQTTKRVNNIKKWDIEGDFQFRYLDYSPGFSMVAVDPDKQNGVILVEFYAFYNSSTNNRMHITISRKDSEYWFNYWREQFVQMWNQSQTM